MRVSLSIWILALFALISVLSGLSAHAQTFTHTGLLKNVAPEPFSGIPGSQLLNSNPGPFVACSDRVYFTAADEPGLANSLWRTDGTTPGTTAIGLTDPTGPVVGIIATPVCRGSTLYLHATFEDPTGIYCTSSCRGLFKVTEGAAQVTLVRESIYIGTGENIPKNITGLVAGSSHIFFFGGETDPSDSNIRGPLWRSDGTRSGTLIVHPLHEDLEIRERLTIGTKLFFQGLVVSTHTGLWVSDGTFSGTTRLVPGNTFGYVAHGSLLYFAGYRNGRYYLGRTDGTVAGTSDIIEFPGTTTLHDPAAAPALVSVGGYVYFTASTSTTGREIWRTDGTAGGTVLVTDAIVPGSTSSEPRDLTNVDGTLYFVATTAANGTELYRMDGTTPVLIDVRPGVSSSNPYDLVPFGSTLLFTANDGDTGAEVRSLASGSSVSTLVRDVRTGPNSSLPDLLAPALGRLFFSADDGVTGIEPWVAANAVINPTPTPTPPPTATPTRTPTPTPGTGVGSYNLGGDVTRSAGIPLAGVTIRLIEVLTGRTVASTTTDANGVYVLTGVVTATGDYRITATHSSYLFSSPFTRRLTASAVNATSRGLDFSASTPQPTPTVAPRPSPPVVASKRAVGRQGSKIPLRFTVSYGGSGTSERITVIRRGRTVATISGRFGPNEPGVTYALTLRTRGYARGEYSFCTISTDEYGRQSAPSCASLRIR